MFITNKDNSLSFAIFQQYPEVICKMTTKINGPMFIRRDPFVHASKLLSLMSDIDKPLVLMEQRHGAQVILNPSYQKETPVFGVDGIVSNQRNALFGVVTADCVPLYFFDPILKIIAVAHAGWKGTLLHIADVAISKMKELGSKPSEIVVAIGPHIGACCYEVQESRADAFTYDVGRNSQVVIMNEGKWFIDLGRANKFQLLNAGIKTEHIDAPIACTSCQEDLFFSYRRDKTIEYGEMLGIIGIK